MSTTGGSWDEPEAGTVDPQAAVAGRRETVRRALVELVRTQRTVVDDDDRLDGYLRDICPYQPAEVSVVVVAARSGVAHDLSRATEGHSLETVAGRLASRLNAESGIDQTLARWAVDTWAVALGKLADTAVGRPPVAAGPPPTAAPRPAAPPPAAPPPAAPAPPPPAAPASPAAAQPVATPPPPVRPVDHLDDVVTRAPPPADPPEALRAMMAPLPGAAQPVPAPVPEPPPAPPPPPVAPRPPPVPAVVGPGRTRARQPAAPPPAPPQPPPAKPDGRNRRRVIGAVVVGAALVAVVAATRLGGDGADTALTTATTGPPPTTVTVPSTTATTRPRVLPSDTVPLPAGNYTTSKFAPAMAMTLGDAWKVAYPDNAEYLLLVRNDGRDGAISFAHLNQVFNPDGIYTTRDDLTRSGAVESAPDDLANWLAANANLSVSAPSPVQAGPIDGFYVEVGVRSGYQSELCPGNCVPLWVFDEAQLGRGFLREGTLYRIYGLNVGGAKILVILLAGADDYDTLVAEADRIVSSMSFTP